MAGSAWDSARLAQVVDGITARIATPLPKSGHDGDGPKVDVVGLVRYREQSDTVEVPLTAPYDPSAISVAFEAAHRRLYGFATDEAWDLEAVRVTVSAGANRPIGPVPRTTALRSPRASRRAQCWFEAGGPSTTSFYDREALIPDERIAGPVIIEDPWSTVVVPPGAAVWADCHANLQIAAMETAR
jgi:N-methylhydantoinase A